MRDKMEIKDLKAIYKQCDTFVVCSTQNQVVNYIPIVNMLEEKTEGDSKVRLLNITYENNEKARFSNSEWDQNLNSAFSEGIKNQNFIASKRENNKENFINICVPRIYNISDYERAIKKETGKSNNIVWNLTGGQRSILLTVLKLIKKDLHQKEHTIIYMEGNTNRFIIGRVENNDIIYRELNGTYGCKDLNIKLVLGLAGFHVKDYSSSSLYGNKKEKTREEEAIKYLYKYYSKKDEDTGKEEKWAVFRKKLLESQSKKLANEQENEESSGKKGAQENKNSSESKKTKNNSKETEENGENFNEAFEYFKNEIGEKEYKEDDITVLKNVKDKNRNKLGYWLEMMLVHCLEVAIEKLEKQKKFKDYFLEIGHSIVLKGKEDKFCEFDVVLLTKTGQVVIFECKSGVIDSDIAKARMYTAYAAGGVYGTPILIPAYLSYDETLVDAAGKTKKGKDLTVWGKMKITRDAAFRAQMDVWHLDEIQEKLEDLFDEVALEKK